MNLSIVAAYLAILVVMVVVDLVWLGLIAKPMFQQGIGHLMAAKPRLAAAAVFYAIYPIGVLVFAIAPTGEPGTWSSVLAKAALFGIFAYATYELTNLAMLRGWPVRIVLIDIAWGAALTALSAAAGKWAWDRVAAG
jgi:uncharacterized membrane protein